MGYKLYRSQKFITVQDLSCEQMRALPNVAQRSWVSGCNNYYKFVLSKGAKVEELGDEPERSGARRSQPTEGSSPKVNPASAGAKSVTTCPAFF